MEPGAIATSADSAAMDRPSMRPSTRVSKKLRAPSAAAPASLDPRILQIAFLGICSRAARAFATSACARRKSD